MAKKNPAKEEVAARPRKVRKKMRKIIKRGGERIHLKKK